MKEIELRKEKLKELFKQQYSALKLARELLGSGSAHDRQTLLDITRAAQSIAEGIGCVAYDIKAEHLVCEALILQDSLDFCAEKER